MAGPLYGTTVVTLAVNLPGPLAAARLRAMGASLVKVEPPSGDPLSGIDPEWYAALCAGQDVVVADLADGAGRRTLAGLLADADLLVTASRPGALHRMGLAWPELTARYPRLCQVAILGHAGSDGDRPGHDLTYQAAAGLLGDPAVPLVPVADLAGAERAVAEGLATLHGRTTTGVGCYREVVLAQVCADFAVPLRRGLVGPGAPFGGGSASYAVYPARVGHVALAVVEPHFRARLHALLEVDGSRASLEAAFRTRRAQDWARWARDHDLPLVAVRKPARPAAHATTSPRRAPR